MCFRIKSKYSFKDYFIKKGKRDKIKSKNNLKNLDKKQTNEIYNLFD